jgi:hypothetical protein
MHNHTKIAKGILGVSMNVFWGGEREGGKGGRDDQIGKTMVGHQAKIRDVFPCHEPQGCTCPLNSCTFGSFGSLHPLFLLSTLLEWKTRQKQKRISSSTKTQENMLSSHTLLSYMKFDIIKTSPTIIELSKQLTSKHKTQFCICKLAHAQTYYQTFVTLGLGGNFRLAMFFIGLIYVLRFVHVTCYYE